MYLNPYYRHIQEMKRFYVESITKEDMAIVKNCLIRSMRGGNTKAVEMFMRFTEWQKELDAAADARHELQTIMGSPTDGLMKSLRPGSMNISTGQLEEKKKA
jgi:hypothetical protein